MRIALLASFTARPIADALERATAAAGIPATVYLGAYNQVAQEILNPASALYASAPDVVILFLDTHALLGERYFTPYRMSDAERRAWGDERVAEFAAYTDALEARTSATIIVHTLEVPFHSPLGILEHKQAFGFQEAVAAVNVRLRDAYRASSRVFLFDYDAFCARVGKSDVRDAKMYYLGDFRVHAKHVPALAQAYLAYLRPLRAQVKKCLVLDCDNTLWGGVVGEDGIAGIALGPTPEGRPFWEFQQHILALHERGVILAINSRNEPADVLAVLREHPYMVLREEHFAAMRVNWEDKAQNIRAIASELSIGTESMVFMDDDPLHCAIVRDVLPDVLTIELPRDSARLCAVITGLDAFNALHLTEEDREKGKMYAQEKQRRAVAEAASDTGSYIAQLGIVVGIERASAITIPRIAQLTQKTNQFTMTTRRYTEADIERFARDGRHLVVSLRARDRFGDSGIVGAAIVECGPRAWHIDTFLLSCRIIGRTIEDALLAYVLRTAAAAGASAVEAEFIPSAKNAPARDFYATRGFAKMGVDGTAEVWMRTCIGAFPYPEYLTVEVREATTA